MPDYLPPSGTPGSGDDMRDEIGRMAASIIKNKSLGVDEIREKIKRLLDLLDTDGDDKLTDPEAIESRGRPSRPGRAGIRKKVQAVTLTDREFAAKLHAPSKSKPKR